MTTTDITNRQSGGHVNDKRHNAFLIILTCIISGLLLAGAFPHLDWGFLAWFAFIPIFYVLPRATVKQSALMGLLFGLSYFGGVLYWIIILGAKELGVALGIGAWLIAVGVQSIFTILFFITAVAVIIRLKKLDNTVAATLKLKTAKILLLSSIPALWTIFEYLRQLGQLGTTWGSLAVTQHSFLAFLQISKITGPWGISFVIVWFNIAMTALLWDRRKYCRFSLISVVLIILIIGCGQALLLTTRLKPEFKAAALQPNINPNNIWSGKKPPQLEYLRSIVDAYVAQGSEAAKQNALLVVWPEATFPGYVKEDDYLCLPISMEAIKYRQTILVGTSEADPHGSKHSGNSLVQIMPNGAFGRSYMKRHLVPFGEYVPYRQFFKFLEAFHFTLYDRCTGAYYQPLIVAEPPVKSVGAAICYESSFSELTREQVTRGAGILAVVTDDTWYGYTAAPRQHADFSTLRAVETDRYVIRSAATGISEIIDPNGHIIDKAPLYTKKAVVAAVQSRSTITPYVRYGDYFIGICAAIIIAALGISVRVPLQGTPHNSDR